MRRSPMPGEAQTGPGQSFLMAVGFLLPKVFIPHCYIFETGSWTEYYGLMR